MIKKHENFESIFSKILNLTVRPDVLEMEYDNKSGIYVGFICLDDHEESDVFDFTWEINKPFYLQSDETQSTLKFLLCQ